MSLRSIYLVLAIVGAVAPYVFFVDFFREHGLAGDFIGSLFVNGAAGGLTADLVVSSLVFWVFAFAEARRLRMKAIWAYVVINLAIGLSCALPLFLYFRADREVLPSRS